MNDKEYQPSLVWAKFAQYAQSLSDQPPRPGRLELFIYRTDKAGAYYMNGGKLYWDEVVGDGYWGNCDQDELFENRDVLGEVTAHGIGRERGPMLLSRTFEQFIRLLNGEEALFTTEKEETPMSQLNAAERIAEKIEVVVAEAQSLGVNVYALVQKDPQGGVYYTGDRETLANLVTNTLDDLRKNQFESMPGCGSISYGL